MANSNSTCTFLRFLKAILCKDRKMTLQPQILSFYLLFFQMNFQRCSNRVTFERLQLPRKTCHKSAAGISIFLCCSQRKMPRVWKASSPFVHTACEYIRAIFTLYIETFFYVPYSQPSIMAIYPEKNNESYAYIN